MHRLTMLLGIIALMSCGGNRSDTGGEEAVVDTSEGEMMKVPGDSVRLEDTLSDPPPSDSVR
jgi:hypothetical protein